MERTTTAWLVLQLGGGALAVGLVFAARSVSGLLFGLAAGTLADRVDRRRQLLAVALASCGVMSLAGWLSGTAEIRVWQVVAIAFALGCLQTADSPARQALVVDVTSRAAAPNAMTLNALASRGFGAVGALGAGLLIPWVGVSHAYFAIAAVYALESVPVLALRPPSRPRAAIVHPPFRQALSAALRLILGEPRVRVLAVSGIACEVFAFSHSSALPVFARDVLRAGPAGLGTLNGALSVGGTISLLLLLALAERVPRESLLGAIFVVYGASLVVLSTTRSVALAAAVLVMTGICAAAFDLLQQTLLQLAVPDEQRGRAAGIWVLGVGSAPAGYLETGALIGALGAPGALVVNGVLTALSAALLLAHSPRYRWRLRARPGSG